MSDERSSETEELSDATQAVAAVQPVDPAAPASAVVSAGPVAGSNPRPRLTGRAVPPWWVVGIAGVGILSLVVNMAGVRREVPETVPTTGPIAAAAAAPSSSANVPGLTSTPTLSLPPSVVPTLIPSSVPSGPTAAPTPLDVYRGTAAGLISATAARFPERVYVPDEASGDLFVIDPKTFQIIDRYHVGASAQHVTPDWDLQRLYVECVFEGAGRMAIIDPLTGKLAGGLDILGPYNLYFTIDGSTAIVVVDRAKPGVQMYFYDRLTWKLKSSLVIPYAGADHMDFTPDGHYGLISTEYDGYVVKVDVVNYSVVGAVKVGGKPVDSRLSPDGTVVYTANQGRHGVSVIDWQTMTEIDFIKTDTGAHGLSFSRDRKVMYITNRDAGTLSVYDLASKTLTAKWKIGGSPDMISVSPDGTQLWISNRYSWHGSVSVVSTVDGSVISLIKTGGQPHGLAYYPQPGIMSVGHNGNMR